MEIVLGVIAIVVIGGMFIIDWLFPKADVFGMKSGRWRPIERSVENDPDKEITEDDMSPMTSLLMFDDFMEDGDLDDF